MQTYNVLYGTCGCGHILGELRVLCTMPYWLPAPLWGIWGVDPRLAKSPCLSCVIPPQGVSPRVRVAMC